MNCSIPIEPRPPVAIDKRAATLQARAALAGAQLLAIEADDGRLSLILTRGAFAAQFDSRRQADLEAAIAALEGGVRSAEHRRRS